MSADIPEEAREQYQRGLYLFDRRNAVASTAAFRSAIALAPHYALAYAGLAQSLDAQAKLSDGVPGVLIPEAIGAATRSIALDPESDAGYIALGSIQTAFTWQWREAEHNLTRGLQLNPQNALGRIWYAVLLQSTGREDQSVEQARLAVAAAPLSFFMVRMQGSVFYFAHWYDEAQRSLQRALEITPQRPNVVDNWIALVDEQRGLYDDAVSHDLLSLQQTLSPDEIVRLRLAYEQTGWRGYWRTRLQQMQPGTKQGCRLYIASLAYARVEDRDRALDLLWQAAEQHCFWMGMIRVDPALTSLRNDKRFLAIERFVEHDASDTTPTALH